MAISKLKLGKFQKKRNPDKENQYIWQLKQTGKMSGALAKQLKSALDAAVAKFMQPEE